MFKTTIVSALIIVIASVVGGVFVLRQWRTVTFPVQENLIIEESPAPVPESPEVSPEIAQELEKVKEESERLAETTRKFIRASQVKGVYINEFIANFQTPFARKMREDIKKMVKDTELNSVVIDIKENTGTNLSGSLGIFLDELHQDDVWVIGRICVFRDSSLTNKNPEWYLKDPDATSTDNIWRDASGAAWFDPASQVAQQYLIDFSKKAIDFGFDELQFDYIRYPDDYPSVPWAEKIKVIGDFFPKLSQALKDYDSSVILSVDLFGYLATQYQSFDIGQRLLDAGDNFDYLSFMLYPSHFYSGFSADFDSQRQLPLLDFPYESAVSNPYPVILRSVLSASDYLSQHGLGAKVRPWLQDFNLDHDLAKGIIYDAGKIKDEIQGAEDAGASGWLLWNSANIYTVSALK